MHGNAYDSFWRKKVICLFSLKKERTFFMLNFFMLFDKAKAM